MTEERPTNPVNPERRKHPRFSIDLPAEYWLINISKSRPARTGDISEGGVLLYLPEKIAIDQYIGVKILISTGFKSKSIEALVRAVWNDSHLGKKDYSHRIGGKFVDISAENMDELRNFLNAQINSGIPSEPNIPPRLFSIPGIPEENKGDGRPMVDESSQEEEWEPLQQLRDETFFDTTDTRKKIRLNSLAN